MTPIQRIAWLTAAILSITHLSCGSPTPIGSTAAAVVRRGVSEYVDCNDEQKKKLEKDFGDVALLAREAQYMPLDQNA